MYVCVCIVCVYICIFLYVVVCVSMYVVYVCTYVCQCVCILAYLCVHVYVRMFMCLCVCVFACIRTTVLHKLDQQQLYYRSTSGVGIDIGGCQFADHVTLLTTSRAGAEEAIGTHHSIVTVTGLTVSFNLLVGGPMV